MSFVMKVNISTICWLVCALSVSIGTTSSEPSGKDLFKPLKQYLLNRVTQEKIKQFDESLNQYLKTLSFFKEVSKFHKRSWLNESPLHPQQHFEDFQFPDFDHEEKSFKKTADDYDSVVGGWWADEPFLDLNYLPLESGDQWNQFDKPVNDEWKHTASTSKGQFGFFSGGTMEGQQHDDVWGKFRSKRPYTEEEEGKK